ncbi:MAG: tetratricopeptide repeat protein [Alphaproteobacteria bacterium]|nr:MAG: tetratricopeptide repeat protein [Alphaproteobacteria bacterium]
MVPAIRLGSGAWALRAVLIAAAASLALSWAGAPLAAAQDRETAKVGAEQWDPGPFSSPYGDYLAARHAEAVHDVALAARLFERILSHAPTHPGILRQAMHQMLAAGRFAKAAGVARRYIKIRPKNVIAGITLAIDDIGAKRLDAAAARLKAIPKRGLGGYVVPLALAWTLAGQGEVSDAFEALEPFGKRRGLKVIHDFHAALIRDLVGDTADADELFASITKDKELHPRTVELAGAYFERQGKVGRARALYEKLLARQRGAVAVEAALARLKKGLKPAKAITGVADGVAEALWDMAVLLNDQNVDQVALMLVRMALHLKPDFAMGQILVGDILVGMERYDDAVAAYDRVDRGAPRSWEARLRAADTLSRAEKVAPALDRLSVMASERPARADALIARGDILRFKKRYDEALENYYRAFARISKIERRHWSLYYSRAISLERSKRWKEAEKDFLKALELRPNQPFVLNYLGYSWVDKGLHLKRALAMIEKAVRLRPNDGFIVDSLGWAHYRLGAYGRAARTLERAITLSPYDSAINDHLGDAYWRVGRRMEARFQWRRALRFDAEPDTVAGIKKKLENGLGKTPRKSKASGEDAGPRGG